MVFKLTPLLSTAKPRLISKLQSLDLQWKSLCVDNRCLIILAHQMSSLPSSLRDFLADETISFVCKESTVPSYIRELYGIDSKYTLLKSFIRRVTEVGYMAARVLKNPRLRSYHLSELAEQVGLTISSTDFVSDKKEGSVFTEEQIKCAVNQTFTCYLITNKLLSVLDS
ncbi:hypothetical protein Ddye_028116 [Dipteronia dyeriana]|uniref:Uncharacterized protein n=1 Tax=Dipteronia dyeriana TaxID=168575 RepID=A0AAD9WR48_9ROSI|nr:hypothetical protein Ddye_028116 [Dipteronia dyeriana]